jgi:hypothetical protein
MGGAAVARPLLLLLLLLMPGLKHPRLLGSSC